MLVNCLPGRAGLRSTTCEQAKQTAKTQSMAANCKTLLIVLEHCRRNVFAGYPYSNLHTALMLIVPTKEHRYVGSYYIQAMDGDWYGKAFCQKHKLCQRLPAFKNDFGMLVGSEEELLFYTAKQECQSCRGERLCNLWWAQKWKTVLRKRKG